MANKVDELEQNALLDYYSKDGEKINPFNTFSYASIQAGQKDNKKGFIKGRNLSHIKSIMETVEKYSLVLDSQPNFNKYYRSVNGAVADKDIPNLGEIKQKIQNGEKLGAKLQELQNHLNIVAECTNKLSTLNGSFQEFTKNFFAVDKNAKQTIEKPKIVDLGTPIPEIESINPINYDEINTVLSSGQTLIGVIDNTQKKYSLVTENDLIHVVTANIKTNVAKDEFQGNHIVFENLTLNDFVESKIINNIIKQNISKIANKKTTRLDEENSTRINNLIYSDIIEEVKIKQEQILEKRTQIDNLENKIKILKNENQQLASKKDKLVKNNSQSPKIKEYENEIEKNETEIDNIKKERKVYFVDTKKLVDEADKISTKINSELSKPESKPKLQEKTKKAYQAVYEVEIEKQQRKFELEHNINIKGLKDRLVFQLNGKTYILPEHIKKDDFKGEEGKESLQINLNFCPTLEEDTGDGIWDIDFLNLEKDDAPQIEKQNKIFNDFITICENDLSVVDKTKKQSKIEKDQVYVAKDNKVYLSPRVVGKDGKVKEIYGYEKILRTSYAVIDAQTPKKLIQRENPKLVEIAKLRALEFMMRGVPGLGAETTKQICEEIQNKIVKKSVLINKNEVEIDNAVEHTNQLAAGLARQAYAQMGISLDEIIKVQKQNGIFYKPIKVAEHTLNDLMLCPVVYNSENGKEIEIAKKESLKLTSLAKFVQFSEFQGYKENWAKKITAENINKCFEKDKCVKLCELVNNQLDLLYDYSKRKRYKPNLKNLLADCTAQIYTIIEQDTTGKVLSLLNIDRVKDVLGEDISGSLLKNKNEVANEIEQNGNKANQETTQIPSSNNEGEIPEETNSGSDETQTPAPVDNQQINSVEQTTKDKTIKQLKISISKKIHYLTKMKESLNYGSDKTNKVKKELNDMAQVLAVKLDYFLARENTVETCKTMKSDKKPISFVEDIKNDKNSMLKKILKGESSKIEEEIIKIINIKASSDSNVKDLVNNIVKDVCQTGRGVQFAQQPKEDILKEIVKESGLKQDEAIKYIDYGFNKKDVAQRVGYLKAGEEINAKLELTIEKYEELKIQVNKENLPPEEKEKIQKELEEFEQNKDIKLSKKEKDITKNWESSKKNDGNNI